MGVCVEQWPAHYACAASAAQIGYRAETHDSGCGRYAFCLFCVHNGCDPALFVEWLIERGCIKADAWYELRRALVAMRDEALKPGAATWDLASRCRVPAQMPSESIARIPGALELLDAMGKGRSSNAAPLPPPPNGAAEYYRRMVRKAFHVRRPVAVVNM